MRSKVDHLLANDAARNSHAACGWEQVNPFVDTDHGIVWAALDIETLRPTAAPPTRGVVREMKIMERGAKDVTHDRYPGWPVRLQLANHTARQPTGGAARLSKALFGAGYKYEHLEHHSAFRRHATAEI